MCVFDSPFPTSTSESCKNISVMDAEHRYCLDLSLGNGCKETRYMKPGGSDSIAPNDQSLGVVH